MTRHAPLKTSTIKYPCTACGARWRQCWTGAYEGLCRSCAIAAGAILPTNKAIEQARVAAHAAAIDQRRVKETGPRPSEETTINGVDYEIVWNGR